MSNNLDANINKFKYYIWNVSVFLNLTSQKLNLKRKLVCMF